MSQNTPSHWAAAIRELERLSHMRVDANVIRQQSLGVPVPDSDEAPTTNICLTDIRGAQSYGSNGFASAISKRRSSNHAVLELARSVYLLSRIDNNNIAKLIGFAYDLTAMETWILAPPFSYQPLHEYLMVAELSTIDQLHLVLDASNALLYLHSCTPQVLGAPLGYDINLLVDRDGHLILSDLSAAIVPDDPTYMNLRPNLAIDLSFGSEYRSPELFASASPTTQSDVWAWACLTSKILTGNSNPSEPDEQPELLNLPRLLECLKSCWAQVPAHRPSIAQCEAVVVVELDGLHDDPAGY
ncbi:hypothetical protein M407DRAFT_28773 [Tulasnella calospora MUT 4182]|uniref:Protein kinase domain-containing protein n=1 Tax=Tulasnella calospora MUT 4182 TaxID=1051891 RepID=A0A0C3Q0S2_9AGAM|nr:hypothetical protein M407DRAFT_28773 [Tulasnella calospora MUT 4182]